MKEIHSSQLKALNRFSVNTANTIPSINFSSEATPLKTELKKMVQARVLTPYL